MRLASVLLLLAGCHHIVADTEYPCSLDTHSVAGFVVDREVNCSIQTVRDQQDRDGLVKKAIEEYSDIQTVPDHTHDHEHGEVVNAQQD